MTATFERLTNCCSHTTFKHCRSSRLSREIIETFFKIAIKSISTDASVLDEARELGYNFSIDTMAKIAISYKNRKQINEALCRGYYDADLINKIQASYDKGDFKKHVLYFLHTVASVVVWNLDGAAEMHDKMLRTKLTGVASTDFKKLYNKARKL